MFNKFIGIKGNFGFNSFTAASIANNSIVDRSYLVNTSLEAVLSISQIAKFSSDKFDLNLHTGLGFSSFGNPGFKKAFEMNSEFQDPYISGNDDVANVTFGLTPTFHINDKLSFNLDFSTFIFFNQNYVVDREISNTKINETTNVSNISLGMTYSF